MLVRQAPEELLHAHLLAGRRHLCVHVDANRLRLLLLDVLRWKFLVLLLLLGLLFLLALFVLLLGRGGLARAALSQLVPAQGFRQPALRAGRRGLLCEVSLVEDVIGLLLPELLVHKGPAHLPKALRPSLARELDRSMTRADVLLGQAWAGELVLALYGLDPIAAECVLARLVEDICVLPRLQPPVLGLFGAKALVQVKHNRSASVAAVPLWHAMPVLVFFGHRRCFDLQLLHRSSGLVGLLLPTRGLFCGRAWGERAEHNSRRELQQIPRHRCGRGGEGLGESVAAHNNASTHPPA
mmetsp:Transcript_128520/g.371899  ORF Transcript_128520/g.371899 Transcript_128520/m.371899 type:complete len:297 (+) Transcript_128520:245-1135(+)